MVVGIDCQPGRIWNQPGVKSPEHTHEGFPSLGHLFVVGRPYPKSSMGRGAPSTNGLEIRKSNQTDVLFACLL